MIKLCRSLLCVALLFLPACKETHTAQVLFFTQPGCIHCEHARTYINRYYPDYNVKELNVREQENMGYLMHAVKRMKINANSIGTPFIVIGDNYVMGWGNEQVKKFNTYMKEFSPKK